MADLQSLLAQKAELDNKIAALQSESRTSALAQIRTLMAEHGLTAADLSATSSKSKGGKSGGGAKIAAKYRNLATGDAWSGRGLKPNWLKAELDAGRSLEDFAV